MAYWVYVGLWVLPWIDFCSYCDVYLWQKWVFRGVRANPLRGGSASDISQPVLVCAVVIL